MSFKRWYIGLDIQPSRVTAIGIQARRNSWQLRHWWQHDFPGQTGAEEPDAGLVPLLRRWHKLLPAGFSLRVGLPPNLVLQRSLNVPPALQEPLLGRYIRTAAGQLFPEGSGPLALDYLPDNQQPGNVSVTVASLNRMERWQSLFRHAGLFPEVFEVMPASLGVVLGYQHQEKCRILVCESDDFWMWACSGKGVITHGWQFRHHYSDAEAVCREQCPDAEERFFCSSRGQLLPDGFRLFLPFIAFAHRYPPLPTDESSFTLASGLALRPEDRL